MRCGLTGWGRRFLDETGRFDWAAKYKEYCRYFEARRKRFLENFAIFDEILIINQEARVKKIGKRGVLIV
jgi:hypothetical protein